MRTKGLLVSLTGLDQAAIGGDRLHGASLISRISTPDRCAGGGVRVCRHGRHRRGLGRPHSVDRPCDVGLSDVDVADVVFAASARYFFAVLDGLGAQLDPRTAETFPPALLGSMI